MRNSKIYPDVIIARNLKRLFAEKNLTQRQVAELLGRERKSINHWVNCVSSPNAWDIKVLCDTYKVSADELLGLKERKSK